MFFYFTYNSKSYNELRVSNPNKITTVLNNITLNVSKMHDKNLIINLFTKWCVGQRVPDIIGNKAVQKPPICNNHLFYIISVSVSKENSAKFRKIFQNK